MTAIMTENPGLDPALRRVMLSGALAVGIGFGGFLGWACLADLDAAAIAQGIIIADSQRKTISHLEGGILSAMLVKESDVVRAGQPLLRLDDTQVSALIAQIQTQHWAAQVRLARLRAEQAEAASMTVPAEVADAAGSNPAAADSIASERGLFAARRERNDGVLAVQRKRIAQLREQIAAIDAQSAASAERLTLTEDELRMVKTLVDKGYERRPRLLEMQRLVSDLKGRIGELKANRAQAEQGIAAAELEILDVANTRRSEIADELQKTQAVLADLTERLRGTGDVRRRLTVTAPQDGRVVAVHFLTPGSAIPGGAPIVDLVPEHDDLVVEASVSPTDIDSVRAGQPAHVRLTAYRQRKVPPVEGVVVSVSPDQLKDQRTGAPYFAARVRLLPESLAKLERVSLYPGMPAEVMITSGARKAIDYFISPITDSMRRSFREE
ncbi:MAG TPA: HlyD family type I secretion periplasmic adaptor subunit [Azospirillum sp.]|nr:HlyD family type I secretion periplasmic adaptor subunit [Azospirillum sp.]